ncbi:MAG: helix-turn-helix domain-containing protein [Bacteroidia bacterium]
MPKEKLSELKQIGINIRKLRENAKVSRAQLAFEIGTTEKQLSRIEYGEINSGVMSYIKIARVLSIDIQEIFKKVKF